MLIVLTRDCRFESQILGGLHKVPKGTVTKVLRPTDFRNLPRTFEGARIQTEFQRHKENFRDGCYAWLGGKWRWIEADAYRVKE